VTLFKRIAPAPLLSAALLPLWLALARSTSLGQVLMGLALALIVPLVTTNLRPTPVSVRRPLVLARFIGRVGYDVVVSNFEIAWGVLAWRWRRPCARFVTIPLELRDPFGLSALAVVATVVPGTVWSELALDRSALMLHVWDVTDEEAFVVRFKARYETPLMEIFE
jgi:multicomponent K+:H+ antiporter subunit E